MVEYLDEHEEAMYANLIAEHMYSQVDEISDRNLLLNKIIDHRCDTSKAVSIQDYLTKTNTYQLFRKHTTEGLNYCCYIYSENRFCYWYYLKKELLMQLEEKSFATAAVRYQYIATVILNSLNTFEWFCSNHSTDIQE